MKLNTFDTVAQKRLIQFSFSYFLFLAKNKLNYASICKNGSLLQFFVKIRLGVKKTTILKIYFYKWMCMLYILLLMRVENFICIFSVLYEIGPHILLII